MIVLVVLSNKNKNYPEKSQKYPKNITETIFPENPNRVHLGLEVQHTTRWGMLEILVILPRMTR